MALPLWRAFFVLAFLALGYVFWDTLITLHNRWSELSHSYSHGYLLVVVAAYLIWEERKHLAGRWTPAAWLALPLLVGASFFWFAGFATQLTLAQQMAIPAMLWLIGVVALGWGAAWWLLMPAGLLYFGIPLWDFLIEPLQALTVLVTQTLLAWFNIPAHVHGFYIEVPTGSFEVAGGCSGLNYLLVAFVIGVIHAYLNLTGWRRLAGVGLAVALALLSNWIRVFALVLIGYHTRMESSLIEDHDGFGWVVFACALGIFFLLSRWLLERGPARPRAPVSGRRLDWPLTTARLWLAVLVAIALPLWAKWYDASLGAGPKSGVPMPDVAGVRLIDPTWTPDYKGFDVQQAWALELGATEAEMVVQTWHTQSQDRKLIYYSNQLAPERQLIENLTPIAAGDLKMNRAVVRSGVSQRLVWWFYLVGDDTATGTLETKLKQLPAWLTGVPRASLVAISTRCRSVKCQTERKDEELEVRIKNAARQALSGW